MQHTPLDERSRDRQLKNKMENRRAAIALLIAASFTLSLFFAGCTQSGNQGGTPTTTSSGNTVVIKNFAFDPAALTVNSGDTVTWVNQDTVPHQVASDTGEFESAVLSPGESYSHTFSTAGTHPYHCAIHQSMTATVTVQ